MNRFVSLSAFGLHCFGYFLFVVFLLGLPCLGGCGGDDGPASTSTPAPSGDDDTVAGDDDTVAGDDDTVAGDDDVDSPTPDTIPTSAPSPTPDAGDDDTETEPDSGPARAWVIEDEVDLLTGTATTGRVGDVMMANDYLRVVIQSPGRDLAWGMFGGTIIDAARVDADGKVGEDAFGELSLFFNLAHSVNVTSVYVLEDGSSGGIAAVVAEGEDDLFDVINVQAAVEPYGVELPYDMNADFPLKIRTTYTLNPSSHYVHITTEFKNSGDSTLVFPVGDLFDSGGDVEVYIPNPEGESYAIELDDVVYEYTWGGFGESDFAMLPFVGFFGGDVSYGYVPPLGRSNEVEAIAATISGVTVTVLGTSHLVDLFTANSRALFNVPAGGSASFERDFVVGSDVASLVDVAYQIQGIETGRITGRVTESGSGTPLANVRIGIVSDGDVGRPVSACYTDSEGTYEARVPAGEYGILAVEGFDFSEDDRPSLLEPLMVQVVEGESTEQNIELEPTGTISFTVFDGNRGDGSLSPAKLSFYGDNPAPPAAVMDVTGDSFGGDVARIVWLPSGEGIFAVKPGTYDVLVSRGFEYDIDRLEGVVVEANQQVDLSATLTRVLDTEGYISADLHVHGINSPDSPVTKEDRVTSFVVAGVEVLVSSDHGYVTDYSPVVESLGLGDVITSIPGDEVTTFNMGHFNYFPLVQDPASRTGGTIDWADVDYLPTDLETGEVVDVGQSSGLPSWEDNLSLYQITEAIELSHPGEQVRQINHARGELGGYFTQIGLDLTRLGSSGETSADPADFRLPEGTDLFSPEVMNAMEIFNGTSLTKGTTLLNDWFGLLNLGYVMAGTGVSDTHNAFRSVGGYARTFVGVPEDDPALANSDPDFAQTFAKSIDELNVSCGIGLFITTELVAADGTTVGMGQMLSAPFGAQLNIRVQAPDWADFDMIEVFINPQVYANVGDEMSFSTPADLSPQHTLLDGRDFFVEQVPVQSSREGGASRLEANVTVNLALDQDAWIVAVARGESGELKPGYNSNATPVAFSNPVFVDADGDGVFQAPGSSYVLEATSKETGRVGASEQQGRTGASEEQGRTGASGHENPWARLGKIWTALLRAEGGR